MLGHGSLYNDEDKGGDKKLHMQKKPKSDDQLKGEKGKRKK